MAPVAAAANSCVACGRLRLAGGGEGFLEQEDLRVVARAGVVVLGGRLEERVVALDVVGREVRAGLGGELVPNAHGRGWRRRQGTATGGRHRKAWNSSKAKSHTREPSEERGSSG